MDMINAGFRRLESDCVNALSRFPSRCSLVPKPRSEVSQYYDIIEIGFYRFIKGVADLEAERHSFSDVEQPVFHIRKCNRFPFATLPLQFLIRQYLKFEPFDDARRIKKKDGFVSSGIRKSNSRFVDARQ